MKSLSTIIIFAAASIAATTISRTASAQTDDYYIFSDVPDDGWVVRNGAVQDTFPHATDDLAFAVVNTIRALQWHQAANGSEYDLNGNIINANAYPPIAGFNGQALDGTTDGSRYNYVGEFVGGRVWQTDRNWANGNVLFAVGTSVVGITYDPNGTLWLSQDNTGTIENRTLGGALISSFSAGVGRWGSLAYEGSTDTLWMINNNDSEMRQYSKTGTLLLSQNVINFGNVWGGEFIVIPEPTSLALLLLGGFASVFRIRGRRRVSL